MYKLNRFLLSKQDLKFAQSILEPFPLQFHVRVGHNPPAGWQSLGEKLHEQQELNDNVKRSLDIAPQHQPHTLNLMLNQFLLGLCCYGYRLDGQDGQNKKKRLKETLLWQPRSIWSREAYGHSAVFSVSRLRTMLAPQSRSKVIHPRLHEHQQAHFYNDDQARL